MKNICYLILSLILINVSGCAVNPATGGQDLVLMSEESEIALGRKTNKEILQQYNVYDNPELQAYVSRVGEELAKNSHRNNLIYRFTVLDSKDVNAFALPGGYIYITRGLMAYLNSEAELAAVLGHEIGHVTARHSVRQYSAAQLTGIGSTLASIFIPGMNTITVPIQLYIVAQMPLVRSEQLYSCASISSLFLCCAIFQIFTHSTLTKFSQSCTVSITTTSPFHPA